MAYNLQDQEQIDELKAFWANNGNRLMWLAVIALAVFAGWRAWNWYHDGQAQDAAREYAGLVSAADSGKIEQVRERYDAIQKGYGSSVYAGMAGLRAAEAFAKANQPDAAVAALENVMKNSTEPGFKPTSAPARARWRPAWLIAAATSWRPRARRPTPRRPGKRR